jgi:hypothetical protein
MSGSPFYDQTEKPQVNAMRFIWRQSDSPNAFSRLMISGVP